MSTSDWISLAACIAAFIALIPAFAPLMQARKKRSNQSRGSTGALRQDSDPDVVQLEEGEKSVTILQDPRKLNAFGKALVLSAMGLCIGVIELILFSAVAALFGVPVNIHVMPTNWLVEFYAIFILPGICLFWAWAHLFNLFE